MQQRITRLTNMVLLVATLAGAGFATVSHAQCIEIERTAEKSRILYDSNPKPFPLLPLIVSEVNQIGAISRGQQFTICSRVDRSTWNRRSAWLQVRVNDGNGGDTGRSTGWITMSRDEANSWIPEP